MEALQQVKTGLCVAPAVLDNATATSYVIDTAGVDFVAIDCIVGTTDITMATLKVQESDTKSSATALSSGADVTGLVYGTSTDPDTGTTSALPTATDDNKIFSFFINTQGRKRYLQLIAVTGDGTTGTAFSAIYKVGKQSNQSLTAAAKGLGANLIA